MCFQLFSVLWISNGTHARTHTFRQYVPCASASNLFGKFRGFTHTHNYAFHMHAGKNDRMTNKEKNS